MTRPIRVVGLMPAGPEGFGGPCHTLRIINPLTALRAHGFETQLEPLTPGTDLLACVEWADVIVTHRSGFYLGKPGQLAFGRARCKLVVDLDDMPSNLKMRSVNFSTTALTAIRAADLVTCATRPIAEAVRPLVRATAVLPNAVDPAHYRLPDGWTRRIPGLKVGVQGCKSHGDDWKVLADVFPVVARLHPEVTFVVAGYCPPYQGRNRGYPFVHLPMLPMDRMAENLAEIDVHLCPLRDTEFNRGKSILKLLDAWMMGKPVVASPTLYRSTVQAAMGGHVATDWDDWVAKVCYYVESPAAREFAGAHGRAYAEGWTIDKRAHAWADVYRRLVNE